MGFRPRAVIPSWNTTSAILTKAVVWHFRLKVVMLLFGMKRPRDCGIYKILNTVNGKFYVGSAVHLHRRWRDHLWTLNKGIHGSRHFQAAWGLYRADAFVFEIVERIPEGMLLVREQHYLDLWKPWDPKIGYNMSRKAGSTLGIPCSPEKAAKIAAAQRGKKYSAETNAKKGRLGHSPTEGTREKLRQAMLSIGHKPCAEAIARSAEVRRGIPQTEEVRAIKSEKMKANLKHHEHLRALNDKTRGKSTILSDDQIANLLADRAAGMSYVALGKKYGVTDVTAKNWCVRKAGQVIQEAEQQATLR